MKTLFLSNKKNKFSGSENSTFYNGFTLIEILAVIIILGIIAVVVVPVSANYIFGARESVYIEHEKSMMSAAENMTVECLLDNKKGCKVPVSMGTRRVYLDELIEGGYLDELKDPKSDSYCNESLSYVIINNTGESNYDYKVCLVCSEYTTENELCTNVSHDKPTCGKITTETSSLTNQEQAITVECIDDDAGCTKRRFTKVFTSEDEEKVIKIQDNKGEEVLCDVSSAFLIDKTPPICTLKVESDVFEDGKYYGPVKVKLDEYSDSLSGISDYGMGTSERVMYDKSTSLDMPFGTSNVTGYVKDKAGNENTCKLTVERANDYKLIYDDNSGSGCASKNQNIIYKHNYNAYGNLCTPVKTGYTFDGWYTKESDGEKVENTTKMTNKSDTTIYAHWTANTYTIAFDGNGNTGGSVASKTCTYDEDCILPANSFAKTGYLFLGWATESDGEVVYNDLQNVKNIITGGSITLYAKWKAHTYTIAFNGNGNTSGSMGSQVCYIDTDCVLNANAFTKTGYTYDNWATTSGGAKVYNNGQTVKNIAGGGEVVNLYARWNVNYYYLDLNGLLDGSGTGNISGYGTCDVYINGSLVANDVTDYYTQHPYGTTYTINDCRATTGHTYNGVSSGSASGSIGAGNVSVQMKFTTNTYTIAFNGNGATGGSTASQTCTYGKSCTLRGNGFSKTNYTFVGWATSSGGGVSYKNGASSTAFASSGTLTLYAKWVVTVTNYGYTGGVQSFQAPYSGTYRLEVWGAQGSAGGGTGGNGGYSVGNKYLNAGTTIYIVVGGQGGYNGGGAGRHGGGNGGGATHMATTNRGVLSSYNSYRGEVIIVAGGGGGGCNEEGALTGGSGGGTNGGNGAGVDGGFGGTQSGVVHNYSNNNCCSESADAGFGRGGTAAEWAGENIGGGGSGYFGGSGGAGSDNNGAGGGGSGYIGGVSSGSMQNGARTGNGYARITFSG